MGVTGSHKEPERDRERAKKSQRGPQREPVRARLNKTLFSRDMSKYGIFCRIRAKSRKKWLLVR